MQSLKYKGFMPCVGGIFVAKVLSLINEKGGVGKTTSTNVIASCLKSRGYKVLCVDFDQQGHLSFSMGADTRESASIYDVIRKRAKCVDAVQKTDVTDILSSSELLKNLEKEFTSAGNERILKDALKPVMGMYDYILIDSPPELGLLSINALVASNIVLIPCLPDGYSLKGAVQVHESISRVKSAFNNDLVIGGIFIVRYYPRENLSRSAFGALEQMAKALGVPRIETPIRHSNVISDATSIRQLDVAVDRPKNNVVLDYQKLIDELFAKELL